MVASSFGIQTDQCALIEARTPGCACATCPAPTLPATSDEAPPPDRGNTGIWPDFASAGLTGYRRRGAPLTLAELKHELGCRQRPVAFNCKTTPGSGHIMVAYGYTGDQIEIADPWAPCAGMKRTITYDTYVNGPTAGSSQHWDDFYGFHLMPPPRGRRALATRCPVRFEHGRVGNARLQARAATR